MPLFIILTKCMLSPLLIKVFEKFMVSSGMYCIHFYYFIIQNVLSFQLPNIFH